MLLMNILGLPTALVPFLFLACLLSGYFLLYRFGIFDKQVSGSLSTDTLVRVVFFVVLAAGIFSCTRLHYLLESPIHRVLPPICDDAWHIQEVNSLVNALRYPVQSSFNPTNYLSFYYAPWMLTAALYRGIPLPFFTIKVALAVTNAIYLLLFFLSLVAILARTCISRRHFYWVLYFAGLWSGLEGVFAVLHPLGQHGFWMTRFGLFLALPNFAMLTIWAIHHLAAAVALLLAALV